MIYISYFLCNLGVLRARRAGWPHQGAWFKLGSWGTTLNVLALIWGGLMIINIGIWESPIFGDFGNDLRSTWSNPPINTFLQWNGETLSGLPAMAGLRDLRRGGAAGRRPLLPCRGQRGREDRVSSADAATGEAVIG